MATLFATLVSQVMTITNRKSLVDMTTLAVQAATLKAHKHDDYVKDRAEYSLSFSAADYYQTLDVKTVVPLWRKPWYLRKYDYTTSPGTPGKFFKFLEPSQTVDQYGVNQEDIAYISGSSIQIRSSTSFQYMLAGCYLNPSVVADTTYASWIADEHPFAIIYEAAAIIFKSTGYDEQAVMFRDMCKEQYMMVDADAIRSSPKSDLDGVLAQLASQ